MGIIFDEKSTQRDSRWGGSSSSYYCSHQRLNNTRTFDVEYECVESYRGPHRYIDVGSKRRRVFNDFSRYKWKFSPPNLYHVCEFGPTYIQWVEDFGLADFMGQLNLADPYVNYGTKWSGDLPPVGLYALDKWGQEVREPVIRDMFAKANSPRFNTAVFLAELDETIVGINGLFKNCLGSLWKTRIAKKNLKHLVLNPHELWLWYRYMLVPTMLDVEDLISAFQTQVKIDRIQDGSPKEKLEIDGTFTRLGYGAGYYNIDFVYEAEVTCSAGGALDILMRYDPSPWGTSSHDVLMAVWERIPFSFIFDWFVNVGDWLQSLRQIEIQYAQSYASYAVESIVRVTSCDPYQKFSGADIRFDSFLMKRKIDLEPPSLPLIDKRWRNTLRTLDLISLSIGTLKGVLTRRK